MEALAIGFHPGGIGLLGSVEGCFELRGRHVVAVAVKPLLVEPVDPGEGGELELVDVVPTGFTADVYSHVDIGMTAQAAAAIDEALGGA